MTGEYPSTWRSANRLHSRKDWAILERPGTVPSPHEFLSSVAEFLEGGAVAGVLSIVIEDSDYAALLVASSAGESMGVVNEAVAVEYELGRWIVEASSAEQSVGPSTQTISAMLAEWAACNSVELSEQEVHDVLTQDWDLAEDAVDRLLGLLDVAVAAGTAPAGDFEEAISLPRSGKQRISGQVIELENVRFLCGEGETFVGIWDREAPGPPIQRYPKTEAGFLEATKTWLTLLGIDPPRGLGKRTASRGSVHGRGRRLSE